MVLFCFGRVQSVRRIILQARLWLLAGFVAKHSLVSTAAITCLPQLLQAAHRARCSPVFGVCMRTAHLQPFLPSIIEVGRGQAAAAGVRGSLSAYREVRDNLSEGLRFYMSLQEAIGTLGQQAGDYALTRRLQR